MKKIALIIAMISLQSCITVKVNADVDSNGFYRKVNNPNIKSQGTFFDKRVGDSKWSNSNGDNWTKAKFEDASGTSYIKLKLSKSLTANFHSDIHLKGEMIFEIVDQHKEVVFNRKMINSKEENFTVDLPKGDYEIRWNSTNATGSYFLEWKEEK
ncbi:hypothetical protein [Empedobacter sedimenti]|uniref:hypothetical protein n=1 Tax=Empedobacter sedimenti TaxID=3042610 RepID=UPI0024A61950|nr:hypothetical protein [Empedobacter sedimenti]